MKIYRIIGIDGGWNLVNLDRIIFVDFDDKADEIIFDNILRIKVDKR
jgi:hypothetical protein